jgi:tetratricopeptide (TPR) repeat protein
MRSYCTISTIFLLLFLSGSGHAQEKQESKKNSYKSLKSRSSQSSIQQLLQEATVLKGTNPAQSLSNIQEALGMSLAQGDVFQEARCYLMLGEINEGIQEWNLALDNYEKAYQKLRSQYEKTAEYKRALQGLGATNLKLGNYQIALAYFQQTLSLPLPADELTERYLDISEVYYQMGSYNEALEAVEEITVNIQRDVVASKVQNQKAKIYARLNEVDKANDYYQSSQRNLRAAGSAVPKKDEEIAMQSTKEEISEVLREQKRYDEDISLRNQSIDYNLESNNLEAVSKDKIELSKSLVAKGETGKAIRELEEAATLADTINNPKEQANAYLALADLFEKNGRPTEALATYKKYSEAMSRSEQMNQIVVQEKADLIKKQKEIEELTKTIALGQQEEKTTLQRQRLIIYGLLLILMIITITSFLIYKNAQASKRANQLLALKSLRSQMNPHFIFNALNSVNQFISQNDERTANKFLTEFSRLMRLVLENSQEDFITLQKEEEIISLYVKLEHYRFRDKFDYSIEVDPELNKDSIELPPMLIQPYIENAVWHGLRYKEEKGKLDIRLRKNNNVLQILIEDDGIGRTKSTQLKTANQKRHNSTGLKNIQERLSILNSVYKTNYQVITEDSAPDSGTRVTISIPIQNGKA